MNLRDASTNLGSAEELARQIAPEVEGTILRLVVEAFERWGAGGFVRFGDLEDHFTVRLVHYMKQIRRERNMALIPRFQHDAPSEAMWEGRDDPAGAARIDMTVAWSQVDDEAYFSIECKRLAPTSVDRHNLPRLYVTHGMIRFTRGYYGPRAPAGAMVGYVRGGPPTALAHQINAAVEACPSLGSAHILAPREPVLWLNDVYTSQHYREAPLVAIRLTHLLFDVGTLPPVPPRPAPPPPPDAPPRRKRARRSQASTRKVINAPAGAQPAPT